MQFIQLHPFFVFLLEGCSCLGGALVSSAPTEVVLCSSWLVGAVLDWCSCLGGALVSSAPTEVDLYTSWLIYILLGWCSSWLVGALETSAPPISAPNKCPFALQNINSCHPRRSAQTSASVGADIRIGRRRHPHRSVQTSASVDTRRRR